MVNMKTTDHFLGDRVSVRCRRSFRPGAGASEADASWLGGTIIARDALGTPATAPPSAPRRTRYVVQLDDNRRVVAFDEDVRRFTLAFEIYETLEKMAS
jgi:hypothetical protein